MPFWSLEDRCSLSGSKCQGCEPRKWVLKVRVGTLWGTWFQGVVILDNLKRGSRVKMLQNHCLNQLSSWSQLPFRAIEWRHNRLTGFFLHGFCGSLADTPGSHISVWEPVTWTKSKSIKTQLLKRIQPPSISTLQMHFHRYCLSSQIPSTAIAKTRAQQAQKMWIFLHTDNCKCIVCSNNSHPSVPWGG